MHFVFSAKKEEKDDRLQKNNYTKLKEHIFYLHKKQPGNYAN